MSRPLIWLLRCAVVLALVALGPTTHATPQRGELGRVALVIGNGAYSEMPLSNPAKDARIMAQTLRDQGFHVLDGYDLDRTQTALLLEKFYASLDPNGIGLFYFAGTGVEVAGRNYLLPVDVRISIEGVVADGLVLDLVQAQLDFRTRVKLIFVDACRHDPFRQDGAGDFRLLIKPRPGPETFIGFATEPGQLASDGADGNSPFTESLVRHLQTPDLEIGPMFARVRRDVEAVTGQKQHPADYSSLTNPFFFGSKADEPTAATAVPQIPVAVAPTIELAEQASYDPIQRGVPVQGRVVADDLESLTIDGAEVRPDADGEFSRLIDGLLRGDERPVVVRARDRAGHQVERTVLISRKVEQRPPAMLAALSPRGQRGQPQPDAIALVVGIEEYHNPNLPKALFAARDAKRFVDYAEASLGIPPYRIALMTDREATAGAVESRVREILLQARREGPIGAVYVFFSGHGLAIDGTARLLTYDYEEYARERTTIAQSDLIEWVKQYQPRSITLFVDACFSGRARDGDTLIADAKGLRAGEGVNAAAGDDAALFSASTAVGLSMSLKEAGQGAFSYVLMRGLGGEADANGDHAITSAELQAWIAAELPKLSWTPSGPQTPGYHDVAPGRVLTRLD